MYVCSKHDISDGFIHYCVKVWAKIMVKTNGKRDVISIFIWSKKRQERKRQKCDTSMKWNWVAHKAQKTLVAKFISHTIGYSFLFEWFYGFLSTDFPPISFSLSLSLSSSIHRSPNRPIKTMFFFFSFHFTSSALLVCVVRVLRGISANRLKLARWTYFNFGEAADLM